MLATLVSIASSRSNGKLAGIPKRFRRLKWNEVVSRGDFVADEHQRLEPWEGPGGFRANTLLKPIYRRHEIRSTATKKRK